AVRPHAGGLAGLPSRAPRSSPMSVTTCRCPECDTALRLAAVPPGKSIKCPKCGTAFRPAAAKNTDRTPVPARKEKPEPAPVKRPRGAPGVREKAPPPQPVPPPEEDDDARPRSRKRPAAKKSGGSVLPLLIGGGVLLFVLLAVGGIVARILILRALPADNQPIALGPHPPALPHCGNPPDPGGGK